MLRALSAVLYLFVAVMLRTDRRLVERLQMEGAVAADRAVPLGDLGWLAGWRLQRLMSGGAVRQTGAGLFHLDKAGLAEYRRQRKRRVLIVAAVALGIALVLYFWQGRS